MIFRHGHVGVWGIFVWCKHDHRLQKTLCRLAFSGLAYSSLTVSERTLSRCKL